MKKQKKKRITTFTQCGRLSSLLIFAVSCNPLGGKSSVDPGFRPGPAKIREAPILVFHELSFADPQKTQITDTNQTLDAPQILHISGSSFDFNRRGDGESPQGLSPALDESLAIEPQDDSDCGSNCEVKNLYFNSSSFLAYKKSKGQP